MKKKFYLGFLLIFTAFIFQSIHVAAHAQEGINPHQEKIKRWAENCKHAARYSQELIFTVRLAEPKGTATNRQELLNILISIKLGDAPQIKKKQDSTITAVKKAPKFTDNFGISDMIISRELGLKLDDFLASVTAEAEKHGIKCN